VNTGQGAGETIELNSEMPQDQMAEPGEPSPSSSPEHRALQLETVADISRATSSILHLSELLSTAVDVIRDRFSLGHVAIFLLDQTKRYALLKAGTGEIGKSMLESNYKFDIEDSSLISRCLTDTQAHIAFYEGKDGASTGNHLLSMTRSEILLPLAHQGSTIGVMTIQSEKPAAFSFEDIPVYQIMADQLSNAIENARLFEQMAEARHQAETRLREMQIMQRISSEVTGTVDLEKVVDVLFNELSVEMGFTFISLYIIDEASNEMRNVRAIGLAKKQHGLVRPLDKLAGDILLDVIRKGKIEVIDGWDDRFDREIYDREGHAQLVRAFVPLLLRGKSIGILEVGFNRKDRALITTEEVRLLNGLAEQASITVENMRLIGQLNHERDLLFALMDNIPDAIYFKDKKSRFIRASKALAKKIGLSAPTELIGKTDFDLFTKEHAQQAFEDEQRILRTSVPEIGIEEKETWPDSRISWVSTTKMPLRDNTGAVIGTFGVSRDITKRKTMEDALRFRLKFEEHITSLSSKFINLGLNQISDAIHEALKTIGGFTGSDRSVVLLLNEQGSALQRTYEWCAEGIISFSQSGPSSLDLITHAWLRSTIVTGNPVIVARIDDLPDTAGADKETFRATGVKSLLYVPLIYSGSLAGIIGIESVRGEKAWSEDTTVLLTIVGEVFMNALTRKRAEEKLQNAKDILELRVAERTVDLKNTNELLESHIAQLNFLNTAMYELSPIITTDKLFPVILKVFLARFPEAHGGICLRSGERFHCMYATGEFCDDDGKSFLEQAVAHITRVDLMRPRIIEDWMKDERMGRIPLQRATHLPCYVAIPLLVDGVCKAILQIFTNKDFAGAYAREYTLLTTLATHAAICLSNALNYQERAEKARLDGELEAARSIQRRFTPHHRPEIPHVNLTGVYYPAYEVGGDYLDYFQNEEGHWVLVIADVCGKGIPAALLMTTIRGAFRVEAKNETSAQRLLCSVNQFMSLNIDDKSFVTALCLIINKDGTQMSYARAGHPMLLKLDHRGGVPPENIACGGLALGLLQEKNAFSGMLEEISIPLIPGDRYLIYTDGLIDAADPQRNSYGFARLQQLLSRDRGSSPEHLMDLLMTDIKNFTRGAPYHDDLTILALQVY
jgi:PAS domain S-box-containing protein